MNVTGSSVEQSVGAVTSRAGLWPLRLIVPTDRNRKRKKLIILSGPTGAGKSALSLLLAQGVESEIISADSMQVYRGMDIGTAKVSREEQESVPHHLIDIRDVSHPFNVVDFYYEALQAIERIHGENRVPIVVGGAGFYLHALLYGPPEGPPSIAAVREELELEMERRGCEAMYRLLQQQDPVYAESITRRDRHKIIRGLEIIRLTGQRVSSHSWKARKPTLNYDLCCWFLYRPREILYERVEARCDQMLDAGLIEEITKLEEQGLRDNASASQAIGYRQGLEYLESRQSEEDFQHFVRSFKQRSRQYVKRQLTWFRHEPLFQWVNLEDYDQEVLVDMMTKQCL